MISLARVKESFIEKGSRVLKVMQWGAKTADECSSFGDDSNPIKDMIAIFAETTEGGDPVIIGYINENQLADVGEKRIYSLKEDGSLSAYIWLKNNEKIELNGNRNNLTRYQDLDLELQELSSKINTELGKISAAISSLGGAYVVQNIDIDISQSKTDDLLCK